MSVLTLLSLWHWIVVFGCVVGAAVVLSLASTVLPPKVTGTLAGLLIGGAVAMFVYQLGFQHAHELDKVEELKAQIAQLQKDFKAANKITQDALAREQVSQEDRAYDQQQIADYKAQLDKAHADIELSRADLDGLRQLVDKHQQGLARNAAQLRNARRASAGCKALVAEYVGALNEANRRLTNDRKFWDEYKQEMGR